MKKLYFFWFVMLACLINQSAYSQNIGDLKGIYYQAVAIDEDGKEIVGMDVEGKPLYEKAISVRFSITKGLDGPIQWEETHTATTDKYGLFSLTIGLGTLTGNGSYAKLLDIPWIDADQFLKVEISTKNDGVYKMVSNQQFMAVPYSYYTDDIADNAITTAKILNETILAEDIATGAVTSSEILNGTILNDDIADNTLNLKTKVTDSLTVVNGGTGKNFLTADHILVGSNADPIKAKALYSSDATVLISQTTDTINLRAVSAPVLVTSDPAGTFNVPNILDGKTWVSNAINYAGIDFGDIIIGSINVNLQGCVLTAYVSQQNVIRVAIFNGTGSTVNFGLDVSLRVFVVK